MESAKYEAIPSSPPEGDELYINGLEERTPSQVENERLARALNADPRFYQPTPSPWTRGAILAFIVLCFWLAVQFRQPLKVEPNVVYANRYSKDHKFRPAASPIITQSLKDGRVRIKGALPTGDGR